jgi:hypothetical protein
MPCPAALIARLRNYKLATEAANTVGQLAVRNGSEIRLDLNTLKLFHVTQTGDCRVRRPAPQAMDDNDDIDEKRSQRFSAWLEEMQEKLLD